MNVSTQLLSAKIQKNVSELIDAFQVERALAVRRIVSSGADTRRARLLAQYERTDRLRKKFFYFEHLDTPEKKTLERLLKRYNTPHKNQLKQTMKSLRQVRESILNGTRSFQETVTFYAAINRELISMYYGLQWLVEGQYDYRVDDYRLETIKENACLEREYVYNLLVGRRYFLREISIIRHLIALQERESQQKLFALSLMSKVQYPYIIKPETLQRLQRLRKAFFQYRLSYHDAPEWLRVATLRIKELRNLSSRIRHDHLQTMEQTYQNARKNFYVILLLSFFAVVALIFLMYMLNRLLLHTRDLLDDLRIASFAFDAHEAMAITDAQGVILKVNNAFTHITGYAADEVIGHNPRILQSGQHDDGFYQTMWVQLLREGYWRGEIVNRRKNGELYEEELSITAIKNTQGEITHFISQFLDISDLKKAQADALHQATHDFLTGLPNRKLLLQKLSEEFARAQRHHFYDAFLFIDLDDFKKVNDVYGHAVGDALLSELADRLRANSRKEDYAARISGDEFCMIVTEVGANEHAATQATRQVCKQLLHSLGRPYTVENVTLNVSVSVGIKLFPGSETQTIEETINSADTAMYEAKERGKNRYVFFDRDVEWRVRELVQMEGELQNAMAQGDLLFYYQPKVDVASQRIVGAELLVRWNHPTRGLVYPDTFLEALKNISMMPQLSEMALEAACQFLSEHHTACAGSMAINVAASELRTDLFVQRTQEIIRRYGIDPGRIEIEILENDLIEDFDAVVAKMNELKAFGIQFSIDDFGVGYSSINYLHSLPVDILKIDRNFVVKLHDDKTRELVKVMIRIAKVFGIKTILEGIDELYQLEFAREQGAEMYQGYYFSRPLEKEAFVALLNRQEKGENMAPDAGFEPATK